MSPLALDSRFRWPAPTWLGPLALLAVAYGIVPFLGSTYLFDAILTPFLALSLAAVGLNLLTGYAGQLSLGSAAFITFLASFENYNTTTFAILSEKTLTTVLAGRVRQGTTPAISALAVTIIAVTVTAAIVYELLKRREDARKAAQLRTAQAAERREMASA